MSQCDDVLILNPEPIERLGGMERFLQYVARGFEEHGYGVRVFHPQNSCPERRGRWRFAKTLTILTILKDRNASGEAKRWPRIKGLAAAGGIVILLNLPRISQPRRVCVPRIATDGCWSRIASPITPR